jgi:hypothetical protein
MVTVRNLVTVLNMKSSATDFTSMVCAKWVPEQVKEPSDHYEEDDAFLRHLSHVTNDKTWIHHHEPDSRRQSRE